MEYRLKTSLSHHEVQLLSEASDKTIERLNVNNKRPQDSIKEWIDCHNDQSLTGSLSVFVESMAWDLEFLFHVSVPFFQFFVA